MRPARAAALGLLHGPAELLPVSSSAHVALLAGRETPAAARKELEVAMHAGTLLALLPRLPGRRPSRFALVATVPPAVAGLLLERPIEERLGSGRALAAGLVGGAAALAAADRGPHRRAPGRAPRPRAAARDARFADAVAVGLAQACALVPGVSRHGAALSAARARGFARPAAHALSREAMLPVLAGATALKGWRVAQRLAWSVAAPKEREAVGAPPAALAAGAAASALSTAAAARVLRGGLDERPLWPFAAYRVALAGSVLAVSRSPLPIQGRVVAITGGARGIGRAIAAELHQRGARVAIGDLDADAVRRTAGELGVLGLPLDVTDRDSFTGFLDHVEAQLGALDVLVNNAGIAPLRWFADEEDEMTRRQLEVNLFGPALGTKLAVARMRGRGRGHVINIASSAARFAAAGLVTYTATKHGVAGLTAAARMELRGSGIEFSIVCPGVVETDMISGTRRFRTLKAMPPEAVAKAVAKTLERPRFEVWVPGSYAALSRLTAVLPTAASEALTRLFGGDRMYRVDQLDPAARARYEERLAQQRGGGPAGA